MPPNASVPVDFDEQTADDWDVDMSVYYDRGTKQGVAVPGRSRALVRMLATPACQGPVGEPGATHCILVSVCSGGDGSRTSMDPKSAAGAFSHSAVMFA